MITASLAAWRFLRVVVVRQWRQLDICTSTSAIILLLLTLGTTSTDGHYCSSKLILTPYITAGRISEARALSCVNNISSVIKSHSGYFTVNSTTNSNLFFWFFPSAASASTGAEKKAPLILWLQGGPGTSSMFGLFVENGPFAVNENLELSLRNSSWAHEHSVLYIDSPVGTGYSFTDSEDGYAKSQEDVATDLHNALEQFFLLFPEQQTHDFYVAGESYAGKYVPSISYKIHQQNQLKSTQVKMNLKGMIIGAGFSDPESMIGYYGEYLYNMGLIGENDRKHVDEETARSKELMKQGNFSRAAEVLDELIAGDTLDYPSFFKNKTGYDFYYNVMHPQIPADHLHYIKFIQQDWVRKAIHVDENATFHNQSTIVPEKMGDDIFLSVKPTVEELLNSKLYSVLLYVGQFDIIVPHGAVYNFIKSMDDWSGRGGFLNAERKVWRSGKEIGGYSQVQDGLNFVVLRGAGHNAPYDAPDVCLDLITSFISDKF